MDPVCITAFYIVVGGSAGAALFKSLYEVGKSICKWIKNSYIDSRYKKITITVEQNPVKFKKLLDTVEQKHGAFRNYPNVYNLSMSHEGKIRQYYVPATCFSYNSFIQIEPLFYDDKKMYGCHIWSSNNDEQKLLDFNNDIC